ncbi:MAG: hypothetical protein DMF89_18075 [Acidobacteria bacterium]|nr:MAG: hypothetical protein DMF89_18075 [Acidobacteriota bacterium]
MWGTLSLGLDDAALELAEEGLRLVAAAERFDSSSLLDLLAAKALAHVHRAELDHAREATRRILDVLARSPRPRYFAIVYLGGALETCFAMWEAAATTGGDAAWASRLCRIIERYARISPPARARALLWRGCAEWLGGRSQAAHDAWRRALVEADQFSLPYETARIHYEIGRRLGAADPERHRRLNQAEEFCRLKADAELKHVMVFGIGKPVVI